MSKQTTHTLSFVTTSTHRLVLESATEPTNILLELRSGLEELDRALGRLASFRLPGSTEFEAVGVMDAAVRFAAATNIVRDQVDALDAYLLNAKEVEA